VLGDYICGICYTPVCFHCEMRCLLVRTGIL